MGTLKVEVDVKRKGDAQEILRDIVRQMDQGYTSGEGWDYSDTGSDSRDLGGRVASKVKDEESTVSGANSSPEGSQEATGPKDKYGVEIKVGVRVFAEQGAPEDGQGATDVYATVVSIDPETGIKLEGEDGVDLSGFSYEGDELEVVDTQE